MREVTATSNLLFTAALVCVAVLLAAMFSFIMVNPLDHDEHMYVTAGVLERYHTLYRDFSYVQAPYLPIVYGAAYKITGTEHYLLLGRTLSFIFIAAAAALIFLISYQLTKNRWLALGLLFLFALSDVVVQTMGFSWNSVMPIPFSLLGLALFLRGIEDDRVDSLSLLLAGVAVAMAAGGKIYYLAMAPILAPATVLYPRAVRPRQRLSRGSLPFVGGGLLGLAPMIYLVASDFRAFVVDNAVFHQKNGEWRTINNYGVMSGDDRVGFILGVMTHPTTLAILAGVAVMLVLSVWLGRAVPGSEPRRVFRRLTRPPAVITAALVVVTTLVALTPSPLFIQYFVLPLPFVLLLMACWYPEPGDGQGRAARFTAPIALFSLVAVAVVFGGAKIAGSLPRLTDTDSWTGVSIHRSAVEIRRSVGRLEPGDRVATLSPIYAVEGDLPVFVEFATGPFMYRVGDLMSPVDRRAAHVTSERQVEKLFRKNPPKAIIVGFEGEQEKALVRFAEDNNYRRAEGDYGGATLYVREGGRG